MCGQELLDCVLRIVGFLVGNRNFDNNNGINQFLNKNTVAFFWLQVDECCHSDSEEVGQGFFVTSNLLKGDFMKKIKCLIYTPKKI